MEDFEVNIFYSFSVCDVYLLMIGFLPNQTTNVEYWQTITATLMLSNCLAIKGMVLYLMWFTIKSAINHLCNDGYTNESYMTLGKRLNDEFDLSRLVRALPCSSVVSS